MSIQTRVLLALALVLLVSVFILSAVINTYTVPRLLQWETLEAEAEAKRAHRALKREYQHLLIYVRESAVWDDTYHFVQESNQNYIDANLGVKHFVAAGVDLLSHLDDDGNQVWAGYSASGKVDTDTGAILADEIWTSVKGTLGNLQSVAGIVATSKGLMVVAAHRVHDSREQEMQRGMMLAGRLLENDLLAQLRGETGLDFDIFPMADLSALEKPVVMESDLPVSGEPLARFISDSQLQLLARFQDFSGQAALVIRINLSRDGFSQAVEIIRYSLVGTTIVFVFTLLCAWLLMRRMVFLPIADLAKHTSELHDSGDYKRRFGRRDTDELGALAREFDELLNRIETQAEDLKRLSFEDGLTSLKNRRYFDEQLRLAWAMLQRTRQPLSLLILDVDDFKRYNDHYGHQQGDAALRAVAQVTRDVLRRAVDTVARYGGEEFAAILPGTSLADAQLLAERVRTELMELGLPHETSQVASVVTVTIGVASANAGSDMESDVLLRMADQALYAAKHSGKNKVMVAPESVLNSRNA